MSEAECSLQCDSKFNPYMDREIYHDSHFTTLLEDYRREVEEAKSWPVKLLKKEARIIVWKTCYLLCNMRYGVPGQACILLERYLANHMRDNMHRAEDSVNWENFKKELEARIPLILVSCIQLAAKMNGRSKNLHPNHIRKCFQLMGLTFSAKKFIASEYHVFRTVGFRLPMWTCVDAAWAIAVRVDLPVDLYEGIAYVVNLCEYHRDRINDRVCSIARTSPNSIMQPETVSTLHLAAGGVLACARLLDSLEVSTTARVASLTESTICYVKCVSDIIVSDVISAELDKHSDVCSPSKKRRVSRLFL